MTDTRQQIEHNFTYHAPTPEKVEFYNEFWQKAKELALYIHDNCPNSRERSLAITNLEECVMWANAAKARY